MDELFHTSPTSIKKIHKKGTFGSFLCFSSKIYYMTGSESPVIYKIEIDKNEIIEASQLFYHEDASELLPIVEQVTELAGVDEETAEKLLDESESFELTDSHSAEISWKIQQLTGECAKILGFRGVSMLDEQGALYMIDMFERENEMTLVEKDLKAEIE